MLKPGVHCRRLRSLWKILGIASMPMITRKRLWRSTSKMTQSLASMYLVTEL